VVSGKGAVKMTTVFRIFLKYSRKWHTHTHRHEKKTRMKVKYINGTQTDSYLIYTAYQAVCYNAVND
jgi:hypothetical protein